MLGMYNPLLNEYVAGAPLQCDPSRLTMAPFAFYMCFGHVLCTIILTPPAQAADITGLLSYLRPFGIVPLEVFHWMFAIAIGIIPLDFSPWKSPGKISSPLPPFAPLAPASPLRSSPPPFPLLNCLSPPFTHLDRFPPFFPPKSFSTLPPLTLLASFPLFLLLRSSPPLPTLL